LRRNRPERDNRQKKLRQRPRQTVPFHPRPAETARVKTQKK
jgi:hypothetical protein